MFHGSKLPNPVPASAYDDYVRIQGEELEGYSKPTVLFQGDTHLFRIDKPLFSPKAKRPFENFTRVETFGWPDSRWIHVSVDPAIRNCSPARRRSCRATACVICRVCRRCRVCRLPATVATGADGSYQITPTVPRTCWRIARPSYTEQTSDTP